MTELTITHPEGVLSLAPGKTLRVGRDERMDLRLVHPDISRRHAVIYYSDGWCIADEGSSNGTFLNGERISAARLPDAGAVIGLGAQTGGLEIRVTPGRGNESGGAAVGQSPFASDSLYETVLAGPTPNPFRSSEPAPAMAGPGVVTIGKAPDNDIVIDDVHASRHHARVSGRPGGLLVEDLNSLNGTFLNAAPIQRAFMTEGDVLTVGNSDFVCEGSRLVPARVSRSGEGGLQAEGVTFAIRGGKRLISDVTFSAGRGTLTAVIGPSGAGKSTLSRLLSGVTDPTAGSVRFDGFDLARDYETVKSRVGLVPQEDVVHRQLSVSRALSYAAQLRLADGLPNDAKRSQVAKVTDQLGLAAHGKTRIDRLSGGQRKRASVAMELLTEPSLLILDEPTSGLDPALDRQVMHTLRELADGDRTVLVITHSVAYLDVCDQVLVLAPGGLVAYAGPPRDIAAHFGTSDWGDIFGELAANPAAAEQAWRAARDQVREVRSPSASSPRRGGVRRESSWIRQFTTLIARQVNLMVADRGYILFLAALPFVIGLMPFVVPGSSGLTAVDPEDFAQSGEPRSVLSLLIIGATFMGISMSIRDLVGERPIFLRERAVGLLPSAYLLAKVVVYGVFSGVAAYIMLMVAAWVKEPPTSGVMGFGSALTELWMPIALTTWVAALLGLAISSIVTSNDQVMPVLIVVLMVQLVLHGGLIPILDNDALNAASKAVPARWGYAAAASGIDLESLSRDAQPPGVEQEADPIWESRRLIWTLNMTALSLFGALFTAIAWIRLRAGRR